MARSGAWHARVHWLMLACCAVFGVSVAAASADGVPAVAAAAHQAATGHQEAAGHRPVVARLDARVAAAARPSPGGATRRTLRGASDRRASGPDTHPAALSGFDCRTMTHCLAVGANAPAMATRLVGEEWNGTSWWRIPAVPRPAGAATVAPGGVACPASHQCVAVGVAYPRTGAGYFAIAAHWNGLRWTTVRAAAPGSASLLASVSCPLPASCYAAGEYTPKGSPAFAPLIEHWNGTTWSAQAVPVPKGSRYGTLTGVSCPSDKFCVAVGTDGASVLIERWNGKAWHIAATDAAPGMLYGVSCPAPASCFAVGGGQAGGGALVERWSGGRWRESAPPVPAGAQYPWLQSVSCVSPDHCLAVGDDINPGTYAAAWNGRSWKLVRMTAKGPHVAYLQQVRCLAATSCVALGATTQVAATQRPESAFWNGKTWRIVPTA